MKVSIYIKFYQFNMISISNNVLLIMVRFHYHCIIVYFKIILIGLKQQDNE